ncbi:hypothetical protein Tco_0542523 [Tanacetum coccineum]
MDPNTSIGRLCLGEDNHISLNDGVESKGEWDAPEYNDTSNSRKKKEAKAFTFYRMETEEISERYVAPCFVNGLEEYDGEISLETDKNLISNEFAVKLCLEHEDDDIELGLVLGRSFLKLTKGIANFRNGIITIYPELDPFLDDSNKSNNSRDDWVDILEGIDFGDIPEIDGIDVSSFESKIGKSSRNKKKPHGNYKMTYKPRPIIETIKFIDQHKKLLDSVMLDKLKLDGEVEFDEEEATKEIDWFALADTGSNINVLPYQLYTKLGREEAKPVGNKITMLDYSKAEPMGILRDVRFYVAAVKNKQEEKDSEEEEEYSVKRDKNGKPFYGPATSKYLNRDDLLDRALALQETIGTHDDKADSSRPKQSPQHETVEEVMLLRVYHEFLLWGTSNKAAKTRYNTNLACLLPKQIHSSVIVDWDVLNNMGFAKEIEAMLEIKINEEGFEVYFQRGLRSDENFNARDYWLSIAARRSYICREVLPRLLGIITKLEKRMGLLTDEVLNSLCALTDCRVLDTTTLRELIGPNGKLITEDPAPGAPRVTMPRGPRPSMRDLYDRMGNMEIRQGTLERMARRQLYHTDRYAELFEHMAEHHGHTLQGAYPLPGYDKEPHEDED